MQQKLQDHFLHAGLSRNSDKVIAISCSILSVEYVSVRHPAASYAAIGDTM